MILKPFIVTSDAVDYDFVMRESIDSEAVKLQVNDLVADNHAYVQWEAMCQQLGLAESGAISNMRFGVFDAGDLVGIWGLAKLEYVSGPWDNTTDWNVVDEGADALWTARPMPGIQSIGDSAEIDLAIETAVSLLAGGAPFRSQEDIRVGFTELHWAVLKSHTDDISERAKALHQAAIDDVRLTVTEIEDPEEPLRTLAKLELA